MRLKVRCLLGLFLLAALWCGGARAQFQPIPIPEPAPVPLPPLPDPGIMQPLPTPIPDPLPLPPPLPPPLPDPVPVPPLPLPEPVPVPPLPNPDPVNPTPLPDPIPSPSSVTNYPDPGQRLSPTGTGGGTSYTPEPSPRQKHRVFAQLRLFARENAYVLGCPHRSD